ncbi:MAG: hypothetical protein ABDH61_01395 [Acidilobaceae archaeon]
MGKERRARREERSRASLLWGKRWRCLRRGRREREARKMPRKPRRLA